MNMNMNTNTETESQPQAKVPRNEVQHRAYHLWEAAGRPAGRDLEYWLQAEAELLAGNHRTRPQAGASETSPKPEIPHALIPATREPSGGKAANRKAAFVLLEKSARVGSSRSGSPKAG
jgi:hypothetical protein